MVEITNSSELLLWLQSKNLLENSPCFWWPNYGTFEVIVGAILTQNTKWENVEKSLANLKKFLGSDFGLHSLASIEISFLTNLIAPSGFKNQKASRLKLLCKNILEEFGDFDNFAKNIDRDWLLLQKGIGCESADAILCYACGRDEMVVDSYTAKLVQKFGYEFESYEELKDWLMVGVNENFDKIQTLYGRNITLNEVFSRFHGKIVEYSKRKGV